MCIASGVTQGSVMGWFLFIIVYVSNFGLGWITEFGYADDMMLTKVL